MGTIGWPELVTIGAVACVVVPAVVIGLVVWMVRRRNAPPGTPAEGEKAEP